jgi:hypothetical protein
MSRHASITLLRLLPGAGYVLTSTHAPQVKAYRARWRG